MNATEITKDHLWIGRTLIGGSRGYMRPKLIIEVGKQIGITGVDHGNTTITEIHKGVIVAKQKGQSGWSGRGITSYYPTVYFILKHDKEFKIIDAYRVEYGRNIKDGKSAIEKIINLLTTTNV